MATAAIIPHLPALKMLKQGFVQYLLTPHQIKRYGLQYRYITTEQGGYLYSTSTVLCSTKRIHLGQPIENNK